MLLPLACLLAASASAAAQPVDMFGYSWVVASPYTTSFQEPHASACARFGRLPTTQSVTLSNSTVKWSSASLNTVSEALGFKYGGLKGCCTPGAWCNGTDSSAVCHSNVFGDSFYNYGW